MAIALLLAAGSGERLGASVPKAFVELAGKPLLQWSLDVLAECNAIKRIVLAIPADIAEKPDLDRSSVEPNAKWSSAAGAPLDVALTGVALPTNAVCVTGGAVRSASVANALAAAGPGGPVLVHDAARPLLTAELVQSTLDALARDEFDAAIAAAPVTDTVKRAAGTPPVVVGTLDRAELWSAQTPQVFRRESLERALDVPEEMLAQATDDAWLIERVGGRVAIVPASAHNLKITTSTDLKLAELLLSAG